jgi:hypothetical protein
MTREHRLCITSPQLNVTISLEEGFADRNTFGGEEDVVCRKARCCAVDFDADVPRRRMKSTNQQHLTPRRETGLVAHTDELTYQCLSQGSKATHIGGVMRLFLCRC